MPYLSVLRTSINDKLQQLEDEISHGNHDLPHLLEARPYALFDDADSLPTQQIFDLVEQLRVDLKAIDSLLTPTRFKLVEQGMLPYKTAALNVAVTLNVADLIETLGGSATLASLAAQTNVNAHKLGRVLRTLAADFIFRETAPDVFGNTRHSVALRSTGARSFLTFITDLGMRCATGIGDDVRDADTRDSFAEETAPFCKVVAGDGRTFAQYMGDPANAAMVELGNEGVVGWLNKLTRASLLGDYPWGELGDVTVVDLGAGMGDSGVDVMRRFQGIRWVYQDLEPVIALLKTNYPEDLKSKVADGSISFVAQDYFKPNVSDGAVWYMRGVLHEYDDDQALVLLKNITTAMRRTPRAKMVINEVLNSSPNIIPPSSNSPPSDHIPTRQSALPETANIMTWSTFSLFGGKERSYQEYEALLATAGLRIDRLFRFRTFTVMMEAVLV